MEQRTDEWLAARAGKVTASRVADVLATVKTGEAAARANYRAQLVAERLTGKPADAGFQSAAMKWGNDAEPLARAAYEAETGCMVQECGFIEHPTIAMAGASPDGLVGADGLIEIKCPETKAHIETLLLDRIPSQYEAQMLWQIACTRRTWCDFVSFDPRMPAELQLYVRRFEPSAELIKDTEAKVQAFIATVNADEQDLRKLMEKRAA